MPAEYSLLGITSSFAHGTRYLYLKEQEKNTGSVSITLDEDKQKAINA